MSEKIGHYAKSRSRPKWQKLIQNMMPEMMCEVFLVKKNNLVKVGHEWPTNVVHTQKWQQFTQGRPETIWNMFLVNSISLCESRSWPQKVGQIIFFLRYLPRTCLKPVRCVPWKKCFILWKLVMTWKWQNLTQNIPEIMWNVSPCKLLQTVQMKWLGESRAKWPWKKTRLTSL